MRALGRFALFVLIVGGGFALVRFGPLAPYFDPARLTEILDLLRSLRGASVIFVIATSVLVTFGLPATIPVLVGGAVFGVVLGGVLSLSGLVLASVLSFALTRWLARDFVEQLLGERAQIVERLLDNHGFWALARLRLVPLPVVIINYGVALAGVRFGVYLLSSAVGMIPGVALMTYFSASIVTAADAQRNEALTNLVLALLAVFTLSLFPTALKAWQNRRARLRPPADRS